MAKEFTYQSPVGISWGAVPDSPQIDLIRFPQEEEENRRWGNPPAFPTIGEFALAQWNHPLLPISLSLFRRVSKRRWEGLGAVFPAESGEKRLLRYIWPAGTDPIAGLRSVVEHEAKQGRGIPWPILAPIFLAAHLARRKFPRDFWQPLIFFFTLYYAPGPDPSQAYPPSLPLPASREIAECAARWNGKPDDLPLETYSRVRILWEAGRLAWLLSEQAAKFTPLSHLAGLWYLIAVSPPPPPPSPQQEWQIAPVDTPAGKLYPPLPLPSLPPEEDAAAAIGKTTKEEGKETAAIIAHAHIAVTALWYFSRVISSHPFPPAALDFFIPGRRISLPGPTAIEEIQPAAQVPENSLYLRELARALCREAQENAAYAPRGPFRIPIPRETIPWEWGIREVRLWVDSPERIFAAICAEPGPHPASLLVWKPGSTLTDALMVPSWAEETLELLLASIWHDLLVGGPNVMRGAEEPGKTAETGRKTTEERRISGRRSPRLLPQPRTITIWHGSRRPLEWGDKETRRIIRRRASFIRGHLRYIGPYADECRLCVLQALLGNAPLEDWKHRLNQARSRYDQAEEKWWNTLLSLAGEMRVRAGQPEMRRLDAARTVLQGISQSREFSTPLWQHRIKAALDALDRAEKKGTEETLAEFQEALDALRKAAAERARSEGVPPPVPGWTYVRAHTSAGTRKLPPAEQIVIPRSLRGLLSVYAALGVEKAEKTQTNMSK